jgi:hypothetical protein
MTKQVSIYLDTDTYTRLQRLQEAGEYDSLNQAIGHAIRQGLDALRTEYAAHQHTLPSKPPSQRDPYGKAAWDKECQDLYGAC